MIQVQNRQLSQQQPAGQDLIKRKAPRVLGGENHQAQPNTQYGVDQRTGTAQQPTLANNYLMGQNQRRNDQQIQTIPSSKDQSRLIHQKVQELSARGFSPPRDNTHAWTDNSVTIGGAYPINDSRGGGYTLGDQSLSELQALRNNIIDIKSRSTLEDRKQIEKQEQQIINELMS